MLLPSKSNPDRYRDQSPFQIPKQKKTDFIAEIGFKKYQVKRITLQQQ